MSFKTFSWYKLISNSYNILRSISLFFFNGTATYVFVPMFIVSGIYLLYIAYKYILHYKFNILSLVILLITIASAPLLILSTNFTALDSLAPGLNPRMFMGVSGLVLFSSLSLIWIIKEENWFGIICKYIMLIAFICSSINFIYYNTNPGAQSIIYLLILVIIGIYIVYKTIKCSKLSNLEYLKYLLIIPVWYILVFVYSYGNALSSQAKLEKLIVNMVDSDLENMNIINQIKNYVTIGEEPISRFAQQTFLKYPLIASVREINILQLSNFWQVTMFAENERYKNVFYYYDRLLSLKNYQTKAKLIKDDNNLFSLKRYKDTLYIIYKSNNFTIGTYETKINQRLLDQINR